MICHILRRHGYDVLEAANGLEALEVSEAHRKAIHLVLTDVIMPHMDGRQLAEHLRRRTPSTRLIFMSGYADDPFVHPLEQLPGYLPKPFTPMALTSKIREVLDGHEQDSGQAR
jgi:CheY-like chemotaxis protein